jgi:hypothetical protein
MFLRFILSFLILWLFNYVSVSAYIGWGAWWTNDLWVVTWWVSTIGWGAWWTNDLWVVTWWVSTIGWGAWWTDDTWNSGIGWGAWWTDDLWDAWSSDNFTWLSAWEAWWAWGFRWWKTYRDWPRPLEESKIKLFWFTREIQDAFYKFSWNEQSVFKVDQLDWKMRIQNKIIVRNTSSEVAKNVTFKREFFTQNNCMDVVIIDTPFVNYKDWEFTVQRLEAWKDFTVKYTLEMSSDVNVNCKWVEVLTLNDSSLNEFYWRLTENPVSEMYIQFWPDLHYSENWFDAKIYFEDWLYESWDETVVKAVFTNNSWYDKWYSEFYFRYLKTKIEIVSALYSRTAFEWKLVWSRDYVKNWEEVVIYLKVKKI